MKIYFKKIVNLILFIWSSCNISYFKNVFIIGTAVILTQLPSEKIGEALEQLCSFQITPLNTVSYIFIVLYTEEILSVILFIPLPQQNLSVHII